MITNSIMFFIALFLAGLLCVGIQRQGNCDSFFDIENSNALRGFWCLIVILVHIPSAYQNRIQDMLGSFAYIGVTFFFMTSAYGLNLQISKKPEKLNTFWRKRIPKLLIPCLLVNIVSVIVVLIEGSEFSLRSIIQINPWVVWLLICYCFFWISNKLSGRGDWSNVFVIAFSSLVYGFRNQISGTTWCPEIIGFVWGQLLFIYKEKIWDYSRKKGKKCILMAFSLAFLCGCLYLKFKHIVFWGDYLLKIVLGLLILLFMLMVNCHLRFGNKISRFLGNISYEVYLSHGVVFSLIIYIAPKLNSGMFVAVSLVFTVLISTVINRMSKLIFGWLKRFFAKQ